MSQQFAKAPIRYTGKTGYFLIFSLLSFQQHLTEAI